MPTHKKTPQDGPEEKPKAVEPAAAPAAPEKPKVASNGKRILVVEDERPLAHALAMKLTNEGFTVETVMNGEEALAAIKKGDYQLMLLDLIMPKMDGFAVLEQMKVLGSKVQVIVLSNLGQDEDRTKAKTLGAIDYFVKSNTPIADIVRRVKSTI